MMLQTKLVVTTLSVLIAAVFQTERATAQVINQDSPVCKGVFDFYFVLDRQGTNN